MNKILMKWREAPVMARSSIMFMITTLVVNGVSFLTTPFFTRIMSTSDYGQITTYNSWLSIIEVFATMGLTSAGILNVFYNEHRQNRAKLISSLVIFSNAATVFCFGVITVLRFLNVVILPDELILLMLIHFLFYPAFVFWLTDKRYEYQYRAASVIVIISTVFSQLFSLVCVLLSDSEKASVRLWTAESGTLLCYIPIYILLLVRGRTFVSSNIWKSVFAASVPLLPHYLSQHIMASSDKIMISNLVSQGDTGIYNVASNVCIIVGFVWTAINTSLIPYTHDKLNSNDAAAIQRSTTGLLIFYAAICLAVTLVAPEIIWIIAPKDYYSGIYVIPPMACVALLTALYNLYANIEFYLKMTKQIAAGTLAAAVCNIALNLVLIPHFSYIGAAYTTLISYLILIIIQYLFYRKCKLNGVYNDKFFLKSTAAAMVCILLCSILYQFWYLRYGIIIVCAVLLIVNRKKVITWLETLRK